MRVDWADPAVADLQAIHNYISRDSERYARLFVGRIVDVVEALSHSPRRGRRVPEAMDADDVQEILFRSYRILYRLEEERVLVRHPWQSRPRTNGRTSLGAELRARAPARSTIPAWH